MGQPPETPWLTIELTWQRLVAGLCTALALVILIYGFVVRPALSAYVGRQLSQQIGQEVADEIGRAVIAGALQAPAQSGAPALAASEAVTPAAIAGPGEAMAQPTSQGPSVSTERPETAIPAQAEAGGIARAVVAQLQPSAQPPGEAAPPAEAAPPIQAGAPMPGAATDVSGAASPRAPAVPPPSTAIGTPVAAPQRERSVQEIVEALPPGEITVSEEKLNARLAPRVAAMEPIERVEIHFVPGTIRVTLAVFGSENLATAGLALSGGRVVVQEPRIDGPLGALVSPASLVEPIEDELNKTLDLAGREVRAVRIEQGQIVVTLS